MTSKLSCLAILLLVSLPAHSVTVYTERPLFESQLDVPIIDTYSSGLYMVDEYNNAAMSGVFGETRYESTGLIETNKVTGTGDNRHYCSGCNGSFLLDFTSTSVGTSAGVYGVGFDFYVAEQIMNIIAFVTLGDDSTMEFSFEDPPYNGLPSSGPNLFWGITDDLLISSIHFGLSGGGATSADNVRMALDNLTIGAMAEVTPSPIPVPAALWLFGTALAGLAGFRLRARTRAS